MSESECRPVSGRLRVNRSCITALRAEYVPNYVCIITDFSLTRASLYLATKLDSFVASASAVCVGHKLPLQGGMAWRGIVPYSLVKRIFLDSTHCRDLGDGIPQWGPWGEAPVGVLGDEEANGF